MTAKKSTSTHTQRRVCRGCKTRLNLGMFDMLPPGYGPPSRNRFCAPCVAKTRAKTLSRCLGPRPALGTQS